MAGANTKSQTNAGAVFQPTVWTVILDSGNKDALESLCNTYWPPIYSFLRKQGKTPEDAKDYTQGFFAHLLAHDSLKNVHPAKGKFRSFLLTCLNNYMRNEWDKDHSQKRGGGLKMFSIDAPDTEQKFGITPTDQMDPAKLFEQRWARVLLTRVLSQLKQEFDSNGKKELFSVLRPHLIGEAARGDYTEAAAKLRMSEGTVRVAVSRMRDDFRDLLRSEVNKTVASEADIDDEIRHLFGTFDRN